MTMTTQNQTPGQMPTTTPTTSLDGIEDLPVQKRILHTAVPGPASLARHERRRAILPDGLRGPSFRCSSIVPGAGS